MLLPWLPPEQDDPLVSSPDEEDGAALAAAILGYGFERADRAAAGRAFFRDRSNLALSTDTAEAQLRLALYDDARDVAIARTHARRLWEAKRSLKGGDFGLMLSLDPELGGVCHTVVLADDEIWRSAAATFQRRLQIWLMLRRGDVIIEAANANQFFEEADYERSFNDVLLCLHAGDDSGAADAYRRSVAAMEAISALRGWSIIREVFVDI